MHNAEGITLSYADAIKAARRYWDDRAQAYSERRESEGGWKREIDERVSDLLDVGSSHMVLDIGAGPGFSAVYIARKKGSTIVGLDFSKEFLNIAKDNVKRANVSSSVSFVLGSADFLPFQGSIFGAAMCVHTIHHLPPPGIKKSFRETHKVLSNGGRFVLVENWAYEPRNEFQRIALELRRMLDSIEVEEWHLKYSEFVAMLEKAGLKTYSVQFLPREISLSRFEGIPGEKAQKLLQKAKQLDVKERFVDVTIIGSIKTET